MIYVYDFLLITLYLMNSQVRLPSVMVFCISALLYAMSYRYMKRNHGLLVTIVAMMIISLSFSWNPIWGSDVGSSILTWYYAWTGLAIIYLFIDKHKRGISLIQRNIALICLFLLVYSFIPLAMSNSIAEGLKEFIMIGFFLLILLGASVSNISCSENDREVLLGLYIFSMFLIGMGMFIQYIGFRMWGMVLFGFKQMYSYGGEIQTGCHLLMEDASSGTIMLGVGAMLALVNRKKNKYYIYELLIIVIGMACSGRRTGALALVFMMGVYFIIGIKSMWKKITSIVGFVAISVVLLYFMSASRSITTVAQMFDNNGRIQLGLESLALFMKKPISGYGFDNVYLSNLMPSKMIVHNTILRWLNMGGGVYGVLLVLIFILLIWYLKKNYQKDYMWSILYACFAAQLIPDVLNARFFYAISLMAMMSATRTRKQLRKMKMEERLLE